MKNIKELSFFEFGLLVLLVALTVLVIPNMSFISEELAMYGVYYDAKGFWWLMEFVWKRWS
ncbi:TPA: hypothetical protein NJ810_004430 [Vibrio parahaemolyticus]|nr:hypothetical protein [Vibrio parahaemolyticus]